MTAPQFITVGGRKTRVRVAGDPSNPPALLLHGITRSLEDWSEQFDRLAPNYRVITLDLPGFGFSERRPEPATLTSLARGVVETLDELGEQRAAHVVGNSLGGATAMQLLALQPDRVRSLVLVNSAGFGRKVTWGLRMQGIPGVGRYSVSHPTPVGARVAERLIFADPALATRDRVNHGLTIAKQPGAAEFQLEMVHHLGSVLRGVRPGWRRDLLSEVTPHQRPTLIMWGDRDRILPAKHLEEARRAFPEAQTHVFTGIGHMPQIEAPAKFSELVLEFMSHADAGDQATTTPE